MRVLPRPLPIRVPHPFSLFIQLDDSVAAPDARNFATMDERPPFAAIFKYNSSAWLRYNGTCCFEGWKEKLSRHLTRTQTKMTCIGAPCPTNSPYPRPSTLPSSHHVCCVRGRPCRQELLHHRRVAFVRSDMQRCISKLRRAAALRYAPFLPLSA